MKEHGRIILMRHPQTEYNIEARLSGRIDVKLSELGVEQAQRAARAIVAWKPDRIITSPLSRAHAIADVAAEKLGLEIIEDERVIEMDFGSMEGKRVADLPALGYPFPWRVVDGKSLPAPGAESYEDLIERARTFVEYAKGLEGKTVVVTHGGFTRAFMAAVYGIPVELFWDRVVANVSSHVFVSNGERLSLQTSGLAPSELERRAKTGFVPGKSPLADIETDDLITKMS